jgi:selenocysteine lyase/cysteine desulfurase
MDWGRYVGWALAHLLASTTLYDLLMSFELGDWLPEFPVREHALYLDHAAVCPLPRPVAEAMRQRITEQEETGYENYKKWRNNHLSCRHLGSQLAGCAPDDISIIRSTSEGLSLIAEGLDWNEGDEVLVGNEEFAANVAPWLGLARRGVNVVRFPQPDGRIDPKVVEEHMGERTKLLAVSWVAFHTGWIAPLAQLGLVCRDRGVILVVDAIQGMGVLPLHLVALGVDAVVADGHKWLFVTLASHDFFLQRLEHHSDGRKFEAGANNDIGVAGLAAGLDLIAAVGRDNIQARIETLARLLTRILLAHGWDVFSPGSGHPIAGIVAARHSSVSPADARRRLLERRVVVSVRQGYVRFSPHFYTTRGELEALDRILEKVGL